MSRQVINGVEYMPDATGRLTPVEQIREIDLARHELVLEKVAKARALQKQLRDLKYELMNDIDAFVDMSAERYDVKLGGKKGNVTLASFDGAFQLQRQISEHLVFDEGLQAAKALIDECLRDWMQGSPGNLRVIIDDAFQVDALCPAELAGNPCAGHVCLRAAVRGRRKALEAGGAGMRCGCCGHWMYHVEGLGFKCRACGHEVRF